jgi:hypothetical protein
LVDFFRRCLYAGLPSNKDLEIKIELGSFCRPDAELRDSDAGEGDAKKGTDDATGLFSPRRAAPSTTTGPILPVRCVSPSASWDASFWVLRV